MQRSGFTHLTSRQKITLRTALWLVSVLLILLAFGPSIIYHVSSFDYPSLKQNGFYLWAVLFLCIAWIAVKRSDIVGAIKDADVQTRWVLAGILLVGASIALLYHVATFPSKLAIELFALSLAAIAPFTLFFGRAAKIPLMLLGLFGIAVFLPMLLEGALAAPLSGATAVLSVSTLQLFGMPITLSGVTVTLNSTVGYDILTKVDARCAGADSLAIFLAVFGLMLIDRRPRANVAIIGLCILGVVGTYLQNFVRLLLLFTAGYYYGSDALWAVHDYAAYILFPLWFLIFSVIYLRFAKQPVVPPKRRTKSVEQITRL